MNKIKDKIASLSKRLPYSVNRQTHDDVIQENTLKNLGLRGRKAALPLGRIVSVGLLREYVRSEICQILFQALLAE